MRRQAGSPSAMTGRMPVLLTTNGLPCTAASWKSSMMSWSKPSGNVAGMTSRVTGVSNTSAVISAERGNSGEFMRERVRSVTGLGNRGLSKNPVKSSCPQSSCPNSSALTFALAQELRATADKSAPSQGGGKPPHSKAVAGPRTPRRRSQSAATIRVTAHSPVSG